MREVDKIIIHCSATRPSQDIDSKEIERWHVKDNKWSHIGYHHVIKRDGTIEDSLPYGEAGIHTKGHNHDSLGICMIGGVTQDDVKIAEDNFTPAQYSALKLLVQKILSQYPKIKNVYGHYEFAAKACPSFNVEDWLKKNNIKI